MSWNNDFSRNLVLKLQKKMGTSEYRLIKKSQKILLTVFETKIYQTCKTWIQNQNLSI